MSFRVDACVLRSHTFLFDEFGVVPKVGWQIDPFGHSATQAALLSAGAGFEALFFGRIDYADRDLVRSSWGAVVVARAVAGGGGGVWGVGGVCVCVGGGGRGGAVV